MCLLIVLAGLEGGHPLVVASNRDERKDRKAAPPGLFVGTRHRMISPRDRKAGGTWLAVSDSGMFAGLTNFQGRAPVAGASSRGELPHLALDQDDVAAAVQVVLETVRQGLFNDFQLVISDGFHIQVVRHVGGCLEVMDPGKAVVVTNEHAPGALVLPGLGEAAQPGLAPEARFALLRPILLQDGSDGGHRILKRGEFYGTVSSSLIAVTPADARGLVWQHAAGAPDEVPFRNYGNLSRRLVET